MGVPASPNGVPDAVGDVECEEGVVVEGFDEDEGAVPEDRGAAVGLEGEVPYHDKQQSQRKEQDE